MTAVWLGLLVGHKKAAREHRAACALNMAMALLRLEPLPRRGPVDATVDVVQVVLLAVRRRDVARRGVESAGAVVFLEPADRVDGLHALGLLLAPLGPNVVGRFVHREQKLELVRVRGPELVPLVGPQE